MLLPVFKDRLERNIVPDVRSPFGTGTVSPEILVLAEADFVDDRIRLERSIPYPLGRVREIEPRAGGHLEETEVEPIEREVVIDETGAGSLDRIAVLIAEIVGVEQRTAAKDVAVRAFDKLVVEQDRPKRRIDQ